MKYFDSELASTNITASSSSWAGTELDPDTVPVASIDTLFAPTVGSAINQRVGREVKVHKIKVRGIVQVPIQGSVAAGDTPCNVRLILYQDMQTNAAQAQGEQLMRDPTTASALVVNTVFQSLDNFGRFRVLKDKNMAFQNPNIANDTGSTGGIVQQGLIRTFKMNVKFRKPVSVRFNAVSGGTIADIVDNSFHIIGQCSSASLAPAVAYNCRVCYKE